MIKTEQKGLGKSEEQDLPLVPRASPSHAAIPQLKSTFGGQSPVLLTSPPPRPVVILAVHEAV